MSTREGKPGQRHLYMVHLNNPSMSSGDIGGRLLSRSLVNNSSQGSSYPSECLTCHLDSECQYFDVTFSPGSSYFVLECQGPGVPKIYIRSAPDNKLCKCSFLVDGNAFDVVNFKVTIFFQSLVLNATSFTQCWIQFE